MGDKASRARDATTEAVGTAGTEAAARVADVLLVFASGPKALGVTDIARQLHLSKAVVHRILQSLASRSLVRIDPVTHGYRLGPGAIALGARALRDFDLRAAARPTLRRLRDLTGETTTLSMLLEDSRLYLDQYESAREIKMTVPLGQPFPLYAGASSRAMLAFLPDKTVDSVIATGLTQLAAETILEPEELRRRLAATRATGCATSRGERQDGAGSVAAPIFGVDGDVVGSISVCGPASRFDDEAVDRYLPLVRSAAAEISRALTWDGAGFALA